MNKQLRDLQTNSSQATGTTCCLWIITKMFTLYKTRERNKEGKSCETLKTQFTYLKKKKQLENQHSRLFSSSLNTICQRQNMKLPNGPEITMVPT